MSTVEEIVNAVKGLPPAERVEVQRKVETLINQPDQDEAAVDETRQLASDQDQRSGTGAAQFAALIQRGVD